jgi:hypothetical protein
MRLSAAKVVGTCLGVIGIMLLPQSNANDSSSLEYLHAQIQAMRPANLAWHRIAWKTSLSQALKEARRKHKPIFLWAFIHLPNDERC